MYVFEDMVDVLYNKFPEVKERFYDNIAWWENISSDGKLGEYHVYEHYFNRIVEDALDNEANDSALLERIFTFFEEMATSEDDGVSNLLQVALLESIWSIGYPAYKRANELMHPVTKKLSRELIGYLKEPQP